MIRFLAIALMAILLTGCKNFDWKFLSKHDNVAEEAAETVTENALEHALGLDGDELKDKIDFTPSSKEGE